MEYLETKRTKLAALYFSVCEFKCKSPAALILRKIRSRIASYRTKLPYKFTCSAHSKVATNARESTDLSKHTGRTGFQL